MAIPAGCEPPAPAELDGLPVIHAIDGDGASLCGDLDRVDPIDERMWADVPTAQRCQVCDLIASGGAGR